MDALFEYLSALLVSLATQHPSVMMVIVLMGTLRAVMKPLFAFLRIYVASTESKSDDQLLDKVEQSKFYTGFLFVLDWFASVKLPQRASVPIPKPDEEKKAA